MKTLFTTIDEVLRYISTDVSQNFDTIQPYIYEGKQFIIDIIGEELYSKLIDYTHNSDTTKQNKYEDLLHAVRYPLAKYAYALSVSELNVKVGENGFTVVVNQNAEPASQWRVSEFKESVFAAADNGIEELIAFLEKNKDRYPLWKNSAAYSYSKAYFISNASDFKNIGFALSRRDFLAQKHLIFDVENRILKDILSVDFFNLLKLQYKEDTLSAPNYLILTEYIKPLICYHFLNGPDTNYSDQIAFYTNKLISHLNSNISSYILFKSNSSYYKEEATASDAFENSEASGIYGMT